MERLTDETETRVCAAWASQNAESSQHDPVCHERACAYRPAGRARCNALPDDPTDLNVPGGERAGKSRAGEREGSQLIGLCPSHSAAADCRTVDYACATASG